MVFMSKKDGEVGFSPPEDRKQLTDRNKLIIDFIKDRGCSYPAEIARELGLGKETSYKYLFQLAKKGILVKQNLHAMTSAPEWLKPRLDELWEEGIKGNAIKRISWYTLADPEGSNV